MLPPLNAQISLTSLPLNVTMTVPEADADAIHRRRKDMILFVGSLVFIATLALVAMWAAFGAADATQREWGMGVLLLIVGGCIGYLTGKSSG